MSISKGNWKIGKKGGTVVTDNNEGFSSNTGHSGKENIDYYGGVLIAESILKMDDAKLIAAAPEMLQALIEISKGEGRFNEDPKQHLINCIEDMIQLAKGAIKKATE